MDPVDPKRFERLAELFHAASALDPAQWRVFLAEQAAEGEAD